MQFDSTEPETVNLDDSTEDPFADPDPPVRRRGRPPGSLNRARGPGRGVGRGNWRGRGRGSSTTLHPQVIPAEATPQQLFDGGETQ